MALKLVAAPANDPVSLDEAKAHLRVDFEDDDTLIAAFVSASTRFVDGPKGFLGRALIDQTWDLYLDEFPCYRYRNPHPRHGWRHDHPIEIPLPPLIQVLGIFYIDGNGDEQEVPTSSYVVDPASEPGRVALVSGASWPTAACRINAVRIRFRAGYIDGSNSPPTDNVPATIKAAILLHVGDLYANRETQVIGQTVVTLPWAAEQLLRPERITLSMA